MIPQNHVISALQCGTYCGTYRENRVEGEEAVCGFLLQQKTNISMLMKILITTDLFCSQTNGVVTSVKNLYEELVKKGHEVRVLTLSGSIHSYKEGEVYYIRSIPIGFIYPSVRMAISYRNHLIQEIIAWGPDIIHSQCEFFSFQFARHIAKVLNIPQIHTYHTLYEQYVTYLFPSRRLGCHVVRSLSRRRLKGVTGIVAPTEKVESALRGYGLGNPIYIVPSGISLEQHKTRVAENRIHQKRRELGIPDNYQVILSLGRLGVEKNLEELLRLFAEVLTNNEKLVFLIVGDGPDREQLEALSRELGIKDHVIFTGMVSPDEVQEYYQLGDVFVCASTSETQGLTYIEAAANGLPLLCRKDPCLSGVLQVGENGYEYTSSGEFIDRLNLILRDGDWRKNAAQRSEKIAETFDKSCFAATMETIYKSALCQ